MKKPPVLKPSTGEGPSGDPIAPANVPESDQVPARVWRATAWQVLGRLFGSATTFVALALLARELPGSEFGRLTFYLAVFAWLDALSDFGTGAVAVQRTADDAWAVAPVLRSARRQRLALATLGFFATAVLCFVFDEPDASWILIAALYPLTHALELSATVFKNRIDWRIPTLVRGLASLLRLLAVLGTYWLGVVRAAPYLFAMALGSAAANFTLHRAALPHLPKPSIPVRAPSGLFAQALPLGLAMVCQQAYFSIDNLFVRSWLGEEPLGHYNAAMRVLSLLIMGAIYAGAAALPWMTRRVAGGGVGAAAARLAQPMMLAAALLCGAIAEFAAPLLELLFGAPFRAAAPGLVWLLGAVVAVHGGAVLLTALVALDRGRAVMGIAGGALAVNVVLNALWVRGYGLEGAAAATFWTEVFVASAAATTLARARCGFLSVRPWAWLLAPPLFLLGRQLGGVLAP